MLNPFLQPIEPKTEKRSLQAMEERAAQLYGHSVDTASPHLTMGLLLGRLLIRMGEKLAHQDEDIKDLKEHA